MEEPVEMLLVALSEASGNINMAYKLYHGFAFICT